MTPYSTICRACGAKIEKPAPDRHVCEKCLNSELMWALKLSFTEEEIARLLKTP